MIGYVVAIVVIAFIFDFSNGFHDSANSIATVVGTRVLSPLAAVMWAAVFNFAAAFTGTLAVAKAIGGGMIQQSIVNPNVILGGLLGAIMWNIITWFVGIPSSSSHALIGGYAGAAVAKAGLAAITWGTKWIQTLSFIVISPLVGMLAGYILMVTVFWLFHKTSASRVDRVFRPAQLASSALMSYSHGGNDAQKTMGVVVGLLVSVKSLFANQTGWMHHLYLADNNADSALGRDRRVQRDLARHALRWLENRAHDGLANHEAAIRSDGFCAETGGAAAILTTTHFGIPVSTTHTITGSIVGVGATQRVSAVRWGIAGKIVWAWLLTIPAAALMAAIAYHALARIAAVNVELRAKS